MAPGPCGRPAMSVGLGVENIGGGGMGPISDTGIGGSGSSLSITPGRWPPAYGGGVLPGGPPTILLPSSLPPSKSTGIHYTIEGAKRERNREKERDARQTVSEYELLWLACESNVYASVRVCV